MLVPVAIVAALGGQLARTGDVSHWPWEEYGFLGWWLVPVSFWVAAGCSFARERRVDRLTGVLLAVAAATFLSLLYNP